MKKSEGYEERDCRARYTCQKKKKKKQAKNSNYGYNRQERCLAEGEEREMKA